eukprot:10361473-Ditylum_brightwellii.AAC.1
MSPVSPIFMSKLGNDDFHDDIVRSTPSRGPSVAQEVTIIPGSIAINRNRPARHAHKSTKSIPVLKSMAQDGGADNMTMTSLSSKTKRISSLSTRDIDCTGKITEIKPDLDDISLAETIRSVRALPQKQNSKPLSSNFLDDIAKLFNCSKVDTMSDMFDREGESLDLFDDRSQIGNDDVFEILNMQRDSNPLKHAIPS